MNVLQYYNDNAGVCQVLVSRVYQYSQNGNLVSADVDGLLTTFAYDGDGYRLRMSVAGEVTPYTLDYSNRMQILLEQGGALVETKHYLYGSQCISEQSLP